MIVEICASHTSHIIPPNRCISTRRNHLLGHEETKGVTKGEAKEDSNSWQGLQISPEDLLLRVCVRYIFSLCAAYATLNNLRCVAAYACLGENLYFVVILGIWRREGKTRAVRRWLLIFTLKIINLWAYYKPHGPTVEYLELSHLIWMKLSHNSVTKIKYIYLDNTEKSAIDCETQAEEQVKIF